MSKFSLRNVYFTPAPTITTYSSRRGELTHSYSVESGGEVRMTKHEIIEMIQRAGFDPVERDTVYNRVAAV